MTFDLFHKVLNGPSPAVLTFMYSFEYFVMQVGDKAYVPYLVLGYEDVHLANPDQMLQPNYLRFSNNVESE